jgi:prepilin-type N-terminal cleavage/methylation domain-containing protein
MAPGSGMSANTARGFTLVELLVTVTIMAVLAAVALPTLSSGDPQKLSVAEEETANTLRFALSEARRTGGYVLVDGKSTPGQLKLFQSNAWAQVPPAFGTSAINDPLTRRAAVLDVGGSGYSRGVTLAPQFRAGSQAWQQLLIGPGLTQLQAFDGASASKGALQTGSNVLLSYGSQSITVSIDSVTGLVTSP